MKIENKIYKSTAGEIIIKGQLFKIEEEDVSYAEMIENVIKETPEGGFSYDAMEHSLAIKAAIKKSKENDCDIELEKADLKYLQDRVNQKRWSVAQEYILEFKKYISSI